MKRLAIYNPFTAPVFFEETVTSTMDIARNLAARGEAHGTVIAADFQEAGRGRVPERCWNMERGTGLPFTLLLRYPRIEDIPPALTLRCGLALALAIEDFAPALSGKALVKWPNDIMIRINATEAKKAAGILTEAASGIVLVGMGINITQREFSPLLWDKATSISLASGTEINGGARFTLLEKILARLHSDPEIAHNAARTQPDWRGQLVKRLYKKGESVCFAEGPAASPRVINGRLEGLGPAGELLIVPDGETAPHPFFAGELRIYS